MSLARSRRLALAAGTLAALALPAAASAHPGIYTVTQATRPDGATCTYPDASCLATTTTQYAVANDGWAMSFTENNGVTGAQADPAQTSGMINYKTMPSAWRTPMTSEQKRTFPQAQTNLQAHATCSGSALLDTAANVLAWQEADPFFNYVPWQATSAGLGDEPEHWLPVVKAATGVDLAALSGEAAFRAACESAPVSGVYHKADTAAKITSALETAIAAPLQSQVTTLQGQVGTLITAKAAADAAAATAEAGRQALANRPLAMQLAAKRTAAPVAMVTGTAGTAVTVTVRLSAAGAKALKLSRTLATAKVALGTQGAELVMPKLKAKRAKAIRKHGRAMKVTVSAEGAGTTLSASATLTL
jgi:hypothetical protein